MAYIDEVSNVIKKMSEGIEGAIQQTLADKSEVIAELVREQLWAGQKPDGSKLSPDYLSDPYFKERARKVLEEAAAKVGQSADNGGRLERLERKLAENYRRWKLMITPPSTTALLKLQPRSRNVPNLYIKGTYHRGVKASVTSSEITIGNDVFFADNIKAKYGSNVLDVGKSAREYLVDNVLTKGIEDFYAKCGW